MWMVIGICLVVEQNYNIYLLPGLFIAFKIALLCAINR